MCSSFHYSNYAKPALNGLLRTGSDEWRSFCPSGTRLKIKTRVMNASLVKLESLEAKIRDAIPKFETPVSSYDTAWLAMVPSQHFQECINWILNNQEDGSWYVLLWLAMVPSQHFPECINWILNNQQEDGSWYVLSQSVFLIKDALCCILACVLALKRWNIGNEHLKRGLQFILSNFPSALDKKQLSPIGFNIIFPSMLEHARKLGLELPVNQDDLDIMFHMRDLELKRNSEINCDGWQTYLAHIVEGSGQILNLQEVLKYQRTNGSLFNTPSTTFAALSYHWDDKGFKYLHNALHKFGNSVPSVYPCDIYPKLWIVDFLEKLGIDRHFEDEMKKILDDAYRLWIKNDEEIHSEIMTRTMAFRLLRMHGYDISSGIFEQLNEKIYCSLTDGNFYNVNVIFELYKASQIKIFEDEKVLEKLNLLSSNILKQKVYVAQNNEHEREFAQEVDYALRFPSHANLERVEHKRNIEFFYFNVVTMKTSFRLENIDMEDVLKLAVQEFNECQSIYQNELVFIKSWVKEARLDQLKFARQKANYCYFSAAATLFPPEMSDARMSWAKNSILSTVVDDFFDIGGSIEELINFKQLVERWDDDYDRSCCSEQVHIIFSALYSTINELGAKASVLQERDITSHLIEIWLDLINSMMKEAHWQRDMTVPTFDQYMKNGYFSFALGPIILPALYFVGPKLPLHVIRNPECHKLYKLVSTCGRLLNDMQGFERENKEGKLNYVSLRVLQENGSISEADIKRDIRRMIEANRTQLLRLVLQSEGSVMPRSCKDLFWKMSRILHVFYDRNDGFTSPTEMMSAVNAVLYKPLEIPKKQAVN